MEGSKATTDDATELTTSIILKENSPSTILASCSEFKPEEPQILKENLKITKPKPILIREISDIEFNSKLDGECSQDFIASISGRYVKILPAIFNSKEKIASFLK